MTLQYVQDPQMETLLKMTTDIVGKIKHQTRDVILNTCKNCTNSFLVGHKGCCSTNCYLHVLQTRLDDCFRKDKSYSITYHSSLKFCSDFSISI